MCPLLGAQCQRRAWALDLEDQQPYGDAFSSAALGAAAGHSGSAFSWRLFVLP